jgi:hypothetical protein
MPAWWDGLWGIASLSPDASHAPRALTAVIGWHPTQPRSGWCVTRLGGFAASELPKNSPLWVLSLKMTHAGRIVPRSLSPRGRNALPRLTHPFSLPARSRRPAATHSPILSARAVATPCRDSLTHSLSPRGRNALPRLTHPFSLPARSRRPARLTDPLAVPARSEHPAGLTHPFTSLAFSRDRGNPGMGRDRGGVTRLDLPEESCDLILGRASNATQRRVTWLGLGELL